MTEIEGGWHDAAVDPKACCLPDLPRDTLLDIFKQVMLDHPPEWSFWTLERAKQWASVVVEMGLSEAIRQDGKCRCEQDAGTAVTQLAMELTRIFPRSQIGYLLLILLNRLDKDEVWVAKKCRVTKAAVSKNKVRLADWWKLQTRIGRTRLSRQHMRDAQLRLRRRN